MPLPIFIPVGIAVASGGYGTKKLIESLKLRKEAKQIALRAKKQVDSCLSQLDSQKQACEHLLQDIAIQRRQIREGSLREFQNTFGPLLVMEMSSASGVAPRPTWKKWDCPTYHHKNFQGFSYQRTSAHILGAGALSALSACGSAVILGAPTHAPGGIEAASATLSWLTHQAFTIPGAGTGSGWAALGSMMAGPMIAVAGFAWSNEARRQKCKAEKFACDADIASESLRQESTVLTTVCDTLILYKNTLAKLHENFNEALFKMKKNGSTLAFTDNGTNSTHRKELYQTYLLAVTLQRYMDVTLIDSEGIYQPLHRQIEMASDVLRDENE